MYLAFALLSGVVLSVMISVNGNLTAHYGTFPAAAVIHLVGSIAALLLCAFRKEKTPLWRCKPGWMYLGGAIGVVTTVFQNFSFGYISLTSIVALSLLGQTVMSLAVDRFGLLGMERQPARKQSWLGLILSLAGIAVMLDDTVATAALAVCGAFFAGVAAVLSRTVNARLAERVGALRGSLVNHLVGLPITVVLALAASGRVPAVTFGDVPPWMYLGGVLGVTLVLLCNLAVPKVSAFRMTLMTFVGQVFTGILLDTLSRGGYTEASFQGGVLIAAGIAANLLSERFAVEKERKRQAYFARIEEIEAAHRAFLLGKYDGARFKSAKNDED